MKITLKQLKYIRWMQSVLGKKAGVDDDTRRDFMENVAGVRSAKDLTPRGAKLLISELQKRLETIGITGTSKSTRKPEKVKRIGKRTAKQVNMIWTIAESRGMTEMELFAFLKKRITGGRTGDPAKLENREVSAAKKALENMRDRGDLRNKAAKGTVLEEQGNITHVQF